jgi:glutamate racemase
MSEYPIAFVDSGIGGLPYLQWIKSRLPNENYVYLADRNNFPYGEKSASEILEAVIPLTEKLIERYRPKIIVIACNTASIVSLARLRELYEFPFVGVVPAIKPAARESGKGRIGILATKKTINDMYVKILIDSYAADCVVVKQAGGNIVDMVENRFFSAGIEEKSRILSTAANKFLRMDVDKVVLGCTHFIYVAQQLKALLGESIDIIDSRDGVGNQIIKLLQNTGLFSSKKNKDHFLITGNGGIEANYKKFADYFGFGGVETF